MSQPVAVEAVDDNGKVVAVYDSITDAIKDGGNRKSIVACLKGRQEKHRGLYWRRARKTQSQTQ